MKRAQYLIALLTICWATTANAQAPDPGPQRAGFVRAGALLTWQPEGQSDGPYLGGPFGGWRPALGVTSIVGRRLSGRVSAGAEVTFGGVFTSVQHQRGAAGVFESDARHQDTVFGGTVAVRQSEIKGATGSLVATAGIARRKTSRVGAITRISFPPIAPVPHEEVLTDYVPALGGGLDFVIRPSNRVSLVPMFRFFYLVDDDTLPDGPTKRGVSRWLLMGGFAAQFSF